MQIGLFITIVFAILRLEAIRQEELRRQEEERLEQERIQEEQRQKELLEIMMKEEKEKAEMRRKRNALLQKKREGKEPALRSKKVLGRIQHMFEKQGEEEEVTSGRQQHIGSIKDMADDLFSNKDSNSLAPKKKGFQDSSLAGVSTVLSKVKNRFEVKEEEQPPQLLSRGVERRKDTLIPAAMVFEIQEQMNDAKERLQPAHKSLETTDWAWKKKDPQQLAMESALTGLVVKEEERKRSGGEASKRMKRKQDEENQKMLLDDLHKVNERLKKKDALKEHEQKMKEYELFMQDIQGYLNDPAKDKDEEDFKEDIQSYIQAKSVKVKSPKKKAAPLVPKPPSLNKLGDIKQMLQSKEGFTSSKNMVDASDGSSSSGSKINIKLMQQHLFQQEEEAGKKAKATSIQNIGKVKNVFEVGKEDQLQGVTEKTVVKKKIIDLPQYVSSQQEQKPVESAAIKKSSYEWKFKKKSIAELQEFLNDNQSLVPQTLATKVKDVSANLATDVCKQQQQQQQQTDEDKQVQEYNSLMEEVEDFLNADDRNAKEINFKAEVERYLDLIEEPSHGKNANNGSSKSIGGSGSNINNRLQQPSKLKSLQFWNDSQKSDTNSSTRRSPSPPGARDTKYVNDLKNRLIQEMSKKEEKEEDLHFTSIGTSTLKKTYEKLSKKEEVSLLGSRKCHLQKGLEEITAASNDGIKSLEELKAERETAKWKWKEKNVQDLNQYLKTCITPAPENIAKKQEKLDRFESKLKDREAIAKMDKDNEEIKRIREEKDAEFEAFLKEVREYVDDPPESDQDSDLKYGMMTYLDLIDEPRKKKKPSFFENRQDSTSSKKTASGLPSIGDVKQRREMLEQANNEKRMSDNWSVGKVDTSFLDAAEEDYCQSASRSREIDPAMSKVNSASIRRQLEAQYSKDDTPPLLQPRPRVKRKIIDTSMFEQLVDNVKPTLTKKAAAEWKWKQNQIRDLQSFLDSNQEMVPNKLNSLRVSSSGGSRVQEELSKDEALKQAEENEKYLNEVIDYVNSTDNYDHEDEFKTTIQVYLDLIDGESKPCKQSEGPRISEGTHRVSNLKKAIIDKQSGYEEQKKSSFPQPAIGKIDTSILDMGSGGKDRGTLLKQAPIAPRDGRWCDDVRRKLENAEDSGEKTLLPAPRNKLVKIEVEKDLVPVRKPQPASKWSSGDTKPLAMNFDKVIKHPEVKNPGIPREDTSRDYLKGITNEEDRKAAILAKYGFKQRPPPKSHSSSSESDEDEENEDEIPLHVLKNDDLYNMYVGRQGSKSPSPARPSRPASREQEEASSFGALRNIMSFVKQGQMGKAFQQSKQMFNHKDQDTTGAPKKAESVENLDHVPGSTSNLWSSFERGRQNSCLTAAAAKSAMDGGGFPKRPLPRSSSCNNVKNIFEGKKPPSPVVSRRLSQAGRERVSLARRSLIESQEEELSPKQFVGAAIGGDRGALVKKRLNLMSSSSSLMTSASQEKLNKFPLGKSSSFNKFRDAFEAGKAAELSDSDDDDLTSNSRRGRSSRSGVQYELEALRSNPRLQRMMMINGPKDQRSPSLNRRQNNRSSVAEELDDETLEEMAKSKSAIRNMFESAAPKITFGGGGQRGIKKSSSDPNSSPGGARLGARPKQQQPKAHKDLTERKWVFDAINKYFDVIKEDEDEEEEEEEEEEDSSNNEEEGGAAGQSASSLYSSHVSCSTSVYSDSNRSSFVSNMVGQERPLALALQQQQQQRPATFNTMNPIERSASNVLANFLRQQQQHQLEEGEDDSDEELEDAESEEEGDDDDDESEPGQESSGGHALARNQSSSELRGMLQSIVARSTSNLCLDTFKANLGKSNKRVSLH